MRSILDLRATPEPSRSPLNKGGQDAAQETEISHNVAALGAKLNDLQHAAEPHGTTTPEPQERSPEMARETQRAQAAAASATAFTSAATRIPDAPPSSSAATKESSQLARTDYELVLGRGQIASCLFAGTIVVAIFAGGAYFAGKLSAMNCVAASNSIPQATAPVQVPSVVPSGGATASSVNQLGTVPFMVNAPAASVELNNGASAAALSVPAPAGVTPPANAGHDAPAARVTAEATAPPVDVRSAPLFADPQRGALYLQVGAVERGMGMVIAEGLRQHGLASFVAPGPSERIFRVLVGPFATMNDYKQAKAEVDSIDVGNFARQYEK